ncbi:MULTISPECIES: RNA polymerase sigma factor [unclassified Bacteroides]|jgi:RNA polymerase sigma factor (sigma-70 family)|uniref:RNA polymerase sigma factor n=1 Tax=unclassified Bacteroides TaxID=2646097 RepID=UPI000E9E928C|nr:RNA polymerase sigma factor [Bacteroides sp. OM05-12]RHR82143.1 RNA polymerase sigma factor [Bacteroides sp. AF16-49]
MQQTNNNNTMMAGKNDESAMTTLLLAFQSGDVNAFSRLYDLNINILFNYGCKLTTDRELLKDCIHDVFVKIYTKQAELNHIENFKSYLFISLKNRLCDEIRKRVYVSDAEVEELNPVSHDDVENNYLNQEREQVNNCLVKRLLNQLSPRQREALTLYYIEERKYEDICEIMNMNYQSVRNLMHRGLSKLKSIAG